MNDEAFEAQLDATRAAIEQHGPVKVFTGYFEMLNDSLKKLSEAVEAMDKEGTSNRVEIQALVQDLVLVTRQLYLTERGIEQARIFEGIESSDGWAIN